MLTIGLVAVLARSRTVQTYAAQQAAQWLSKELKVDVRIRALEFDFFTNIHMEDVYMSDQQKDTLISTHVIDLRFLSFSQENLTIVFEKAVVKNGVVHVGYHHGLRDKNIDFLIDYINGPKKPSTGPKKVWTIKVGTAQFSGCELNYFDEDKMNSRPGELDEHNILFTQVTGSVHDLKIIDDSLNFTARNLKMKERSGLDVRKFNALCNIHYKGMDFDNLSVFLPCSHIQGELHLAYPGYKYLDKFISNTQWNAHFSQSSLCLKEVSILSEDLKNHSEILTVNNVDITGTFDKIKLKNADLEIADNTRIKGDFYLDGLPNWRTTYCEFDIDALRTQAPDLEKILNGMELPDMLQAAGTISGNGRFTGQFVDFKWNGLLNSDLGNVKTDLLMNFKQGSKNAIFSGKIATDGFDLSPISSELGFAIFDIEVDGSGLDPQTFRMKTQASIGEFEIRGRRFTDAKIDGELTTRNFSGSAVFEDFRLNADFAGDIDFTGDVPIYDFTANTRGLDLYELGLDTAHTLVWVNSTVQANGDNLDNLQGWADLRNIYVSRKGKTYEYDAQYIEKRSEPLTSLILKGKLATGTLQGKLSFAALPDLIQNSFADIFPQRLAHNSWAGHDSFDFNFTVHKPAIFYDLFLPEMSSGEIGFQGKYHHDAGVAEFHLPKTNLKWNALTLKGSEIHATRKDGKDISFELGVGGLIGESKELLRNIKIAGTAADGIADYTLGFSDSSGRSKVWVAAKSEVMAEHVSLAMLASDININNKHWNFSPDSKVFIENSGAIACEYVFLGSEEYYAEFSGRISEKVSDTLNIDIGNFGLDVIAPFVDLPLLDSFKGAFTGEVNIAAAMGWPRFAGEISGRDLALYGIHYGDMNLELNDLDQSGRMSLAASFKNGLLDGASVNGSVGYQKQKGKSQLALLASIPNNTPISALQPFFSDILTFKSGTLGGDINIGGDFDDVQLGGELAVRNAKSQIDYLKTAYVFNADFFINKRGLFTSKPVQLMDETGLGKAKASLAVTHNKFDNFKIDLKIDSADNLKCLNTGPGDDDIYYGTARANGSCHIYGAFDKIVMDVDLKSRKGSFIKILYSDVEENQKLGYVTFEKRGQVNAKKDSLQQREDGVIERINMVLQITPDLETEFVIDEKLGDVIRGRGTGLLRMTYDEKGNFLMYGGYRVTQGDYIFSIPGINLLTKKVALQEGGTITWTGDPFNAVLNMTGSYEKKISPAALMSAVSGGTQKSYAPIKVQSLLYMNGNLMSPNISFDIQTPELETSTGSSGNDVFRVIQRIRSDKDETMRQAVALLLFGNFISPSFAQNAAATANAVSGSGVAGNSLSSIASGVVNDIFSRAGIPTRIQLNIDDVRSVQGGAETKLFINTETFLTERLRLDLNYDPTMAVLVNNVAVPLNFNLEYMTNNENWRIRAFSRSSNLLLQQSSTSLASGVNGNTLGVGVVWRTEFETFARHKDTTAARTSRDSAVQK